jgi:hypothetical protein
MDPKQLKVVGFLILGVVILWFCSAAFLAKKEAAINLPQFTARFDGAQALETARQFNAKFPNRTLGSIESRQSSGFVIQHLEELGYKVSFTHFDAKIAGRTEVGRNIFAFKQGSTDETLALITHYDTVANASQRAVDSGVGIGVLIELARVFSSATTHRGLLLIASDGQQWGMLGARDIAQTYPQRGLLAAVLSLEGVRAGEISGLSLDTAGQIRGSTPAWLRQIASDVVSQQKLPATSPSGMGELLDKALVLSSADEGPILNAGIPAINLSVKSPELPPQTTANLSTQGSAEELQAAGVQKYGLAAERILRALDSLSEIPRESMLSFCLWDSRYLPPSAISALLWLSFAPILATLYFHLRNNRRYLSFKRILRELSGFLLTILPFVALYYTIIFFRLVRLIRAYSFYPPNPSGAVLSNLAWLLLGALLAAVLIASGICYALFRFGAGKLAQPDFYVSKTVLLTIFVCIIAVALFYNPYWTLLFLLLPAWIWSLVGMGKGYGAGTANALWIITAGLPYYAVLVFYSSRLELGGKAVWYNVLCLSTGMFTLEGFLLSAAAIAVGIRLLAIQFNRQLQTL